MTSIFSSRLHCSSLPHLSFARGSTGLKNRPRVLQLDPSPPAWPSEVNKLLGRDLLLVFPSHPSIAALDASSKSSEQAGDHFDDLVIAAGWLRG